MSYIYEALKRAEDDNQQRAGAPIPATGSPTITAGRSRWWVWALVAVLGANAMVAGAWMIMRSQRAPSESRAVVANVAKPASPPAPAPPVPASPAPAQTWTTPSVATEPSAPAPTPAPPRIETARPAPAPVVSAPRPVPPSTPAPRAVERPKPVTPDPPPARASAPRATPAPEPTPAVEAPNLALQVLVYAENPAQRMVFIDGKRYAEGDAIDAETVLERIDSDGIVVKRRGQRFTIVERR
jgi:hypothetical protein